MSCDLTKMSIDSFLFFFWRPFKQNICKKKTSKHFVHQFVFDYIFSDDGIIPPFVALVDGQADVAHAPKWCGIYVDDSSSMRTFLSSDIGQYFPSNL